MELAYQCSWQPAYRHSNPANLPLTYSAPKTCGVILAFSVVSPTAVLTEVVSGDPARGRWIASMIVFLFRVQVMDVL